MKYLITLQPIENYFFGGEVTLGDLGDLGAQNYFVKSNPLPQASALLGLVRYEILRQHELLSYDPSDEEKRKQVCALIGDKGFDMENPALSYGIIQALSPVFLTDGKEYYTVLPLDQGYPVRMDNTIRCFYTDPQGGEGSVGVKPLPVIEGYNEKDYQNYKYWCNAQGEYTDTTCSFFQSTEQIGITKKQRDEKGQHTKVGPMLAEVTKKQKKEKDAFFKQQLMRLAPGVSMVFTVETTEPLEKSSQILPWGGNRSMFSVTVEETTIDFADVFAPLHRDGRLLALGDAYLEEATREKSDFIWGENKPFRYTINPVKKKHTWNSPKKAPVLYHLQARGSVLYGSNTYLEELKKESALNKVGLNIFI